MDEKLLQHVDVNPSSNEEGNSMTDKARQFLCDPLKCFTAFFVVNSLLFTLCATGYWNLDRKIEQVQQVLFTLVTSNKI